MKILLYAANSQFLSIVQISIADEELRRINHNQEKHGKDKEKYYLYLCMNTLCYVLLAKILAPYSYLTNDL